MILEDEELTPEQEAKRKQDLKELGDHLVETSKDSLNTNLFKLTLDDIEVYENHFPIFHVPGQPAPDKKKVAEGVEAHKDIWKMQALTTSLFAAFGIESPPQSRIKLEPAINFLTSLGYTLTRKVVDGYWYVRLIPDTDIEATLKDTNKHLLAIRALHFLTTRHDPCLEEMYIRMAANSVGLGAERIAPIEE